ncbi:MAG: SDR family oxidoreductase [Proteobacteria bacterium]|nr:SDR family oxidoreductase [Pseudomonadota bacterium]
MSAQGLLAGKTAIVAGGGGAGIGARISRLLAGAGASVAVVDIEPDRATDVCAQIEAAGGAALPVTADLRDASAAPAILDATLGAFGQVDALVNVAGGMHAHAPWRPLVRWQVDDWDRIVEINLRYVFLMCRAVIPAMIERGAGGSIVNITSISGVFGAPNHSAYGAAKAGLIHLTKSLCLECGPHGIRCNAVSPGAVQTAAVSGAMDEQLEAVRRATPLGRAGSPDDIAQAVLFFASPMSAYVSGQMLLVDGGVAARFPLGTPEPADGQ